MDIFNDIYDKAVELSSKAVKKSSQFAETVKVKFTVADKEAEISRLCREIGEVVYKAYKKGEVEYPAEIIAEKCALIDDCHDQINALNEKLGEAKGVKICSYCGKENNLNNDFCPSCGKEL